MLRIALVLGGPSNERGISLNSARSVADHVTTAGVELAEVVYYDTGRKAFAIEPGRLYSNTPQDFDFRLGKDDRVSDEELRRRLTGVDLVFPAIHGEFGEDGELQQLLERLGAPYVGSGPVACENAFDKWRARAELTAAGIPTVDSLRVGVEDGTADRASIIAEALERWGTVFLKPARGGSSFDVGQFDDEAQLTGAVSRLLGDGTAAGDGGPSRPAYQHLLLQPVMRGRECTTVAIEGPDGPVALVPTEIEILDEDNRIFTTKHKYLPHEGSRYHVPPRLTPDLAATIRRRVEHVFTTLGMRDFARVDGWLLDDGEFVISDVNPISGMEQTSFLFLQGAQVGLNHADLLRTVLAAAARRHGLSWTPPASAAREQGRTRLPVLFGGTTAERDVSVTSGINVWLKLLGSDRFAPEPHLLRSENEVWRLPYALALQHTVDNIVSSCEHAEEREPLRAHIAEDVQRRLNLTPDQLGVEPELPTVLSFDEFVEGVDVVFLALHGGIGEDGTLQRRLDARGVRYNGSGPEASALGMDKDATGHKVIELGDPGITSAPRTILDVPNELGANGTVAALWDHAQAVCGQNALILKPVDDGCSAGVVPITSPDELAAYLAIVIHNNSVVGDKRRHQDARGSTFSLLGDEDVEMPEEHQARLLAERYIFTDSIVTVDATADTEAYLAWGAEAGRDGVPGHDTGWVEITVGVLGQQGHMRAMTPSVTVRREGVLTLEEKFMGGTGVNLTPPPEPPAGRIAPGAIEIAKQHIERVANGLGLRGYARIDAFMQRDTGDIMVIEVNTLPGLTPATVLFHQAVEESPSMSPRQLLERILDEALAAAA